MTTAKMGDAFKSPWQNSVAERWIGSCRRELLDRVVVLSERHAVRLVREHIAYHPEDRPHLGLAKDTPQGRPITPRPSERAKIVALPRVGWTPSSVRVARGSLNLGRGRVELDELFEVVVCGEGGLACFVRLGLAESTRT